MTALNENTLTKLRGWRMRYWFQNLNESGKRAFHFRGSVSTARRELFSYEFSSGPALRLEYTHGSQDETKSTLSLGLGFVSVWLSFYLPKHWYFKRKCIATWEGNREFYLTDGRQYGFYVHEWAIVWSWHQRIHESKSGEPWWRKFYFRVDDFFLGRTEYMTHDITDAENIAFKLGGKEFVLNSVRWYDATWFRRRIPLSLHENKIVRVEMKIDKPPMRAGKGENSWDCDDDGTYGLTMLWPHERPSWTNKQEMARLAAEEYVKSVLQSAKRYGSGDGERGISAGDAFEYVGMRA